MERIILIDILRCIAIIAMIAFHIAYDLAVFYNYHINYTQGVWQLIQVVFAGGLFIFVSGWTAALGKRSLRNLTAIGACALLVSLATYYQFADMYVRFGILHFMFVANILYTLFLRKLTTVALSCIALLSALLSGFADKIEVSHSYLIWLDITPIGYQAVDHYPLLPWMAVFIAGIIWGRSQLVSRITITQSQFIGRQQLTTASRHSLAIYLLHQPIILIILSIYHRYI